MSSSTNAEIYYLPSGCNCDNRSTYTQSQIEKACQEALSLASREMTEGRDKYPHAYNDYERFSFPHAQKPYLEFPILSSGDYDGESPGADRIVVGSIADDYSSAIYCAVITHDGSTKNGFTECMDDSMNVRGKGKYDPQTPASDSGAGSGSGSEGDEKHGHEHQNYGHGGRRLKERIDL